MSEFEWVRVRRDELGSLMEDRACLLEAAQAVVDQWDTPNWTVIGTNELIENLRNAIERANND